MSLPVGAPTAEVDSTAPLDSTASLAWAGLRRLVVRSARQYGRAADPSERCDLCAAPLPAQHRHLVEVPARALRCACRACAVLFTDTDGQARYRLIPERRRRLPDLVLTDADWDELAIPVDTAFFFHDSTVGKTVAFYPSPAGAVESLLNLTMWRRLVEANPVLAGMAPDVEALLVHAARGTREHWLVPIDDCYALVGLIRSRWQGLTGGPAVWEGVTAFLADLRARAGTAAATTSPPQPQGGTNDR